MNYRMELEINNARVKDLDKRLEIAPKEMVEKIKQEKLSLEDRNHKIKNHLATRS